MDAFYSKPMNEKQVEVASNVRDVFSQLGDLIEANIPPGRYRSVAMTYLETAAMHATKAITHEWKE